METINELSVSKIMEFPTRQVNAQGKVYEAKYDVESGTLYFMKNGALTGDFYTLPAPVPPRDQDSGTEEAVTALPPIRFHIWAFLAGVASIAIIMIAIIVLQYLFYEGIF